MAIKYEDEGGPSRPARKDVGGKTYVAEEPSAKPAEAGDALPFAKPTRPEKKPRKPKR